MSKSKKRVIQLVNYSSDSSDDSTTDKKIKLAPIKLPLPPSIGLMFEDTEVQDDPSSLGGRTRSFPHMRGNWVSYVYIELTHDLLEKVAKNILSNFGDLKLEPFQDFHISLSRTLPIPYHWLHQMTSSLKSLADTLQPFYVTFKGVKIFQNDDNSRYFVAVLVDIGISDLSWIQQRVDGIMSGYKLPVFYKPASFHTSLLWTVKKCPNGTEQIVEKLWHEVVSEVLSGIEFEVEAINFKTGHKSYTFTFKK
ncbi:U6 snRNA phosphodiesterase [Oopsacas minuta]|uniref:U6 snRNA phosphodiesterase 1 n=1 Tax=Oopsacas minuta TaxID=111878 RepID=A0AAV7JE72_9METZ|nr:U6 snRNA phosphodiesterase [Oopsacas minuta]